MPTDPFLALCHGAPVSSELFSEIRDRFNVSITAGSIRYSNIGPTPVTLVYSVNGIVKWWFESPRVKFRFYEKMKGQGVPDQSRTGRYFRGVTPPQEMACLAKLWFPNDHSVKQDSYLNELILPQPTFNSCITYLWEFVPL
jgi:hypothetical protein